MTLKNKIRLIFIVCGVTVILIGGLFIWGRIVGNRESEEIKPWITYGRLMYAASRCDLYEKQYGVWPNSLAQLRAFRPEFNDWAKDAWGQNGSVWGRDFELVPYKKSLGYGELISYGRDEKPGGTGADRDLIVRFPLDTNTNWNQQMGTGLKEPRFNP